MAGTPGHDAVFDFCDPVTLEDQPTPVAELVLRSVCKLWRQTAIRCGRIFTLEFVTRASIRIAEFDRWQLKREFILTSNVRHRGSQPVFKPSSLPPDRKLLSIDLHAAQNCPQLRRMLTSLRRSSSTGCPVSSSLLA